MDLETRTLASLDWPLVLERLAFHARTLRGAAEARRMVPAREREEVLARYGAVLEVGAAEDRGEEIPLGGILDVAGPVARAARGEVLEVPELVDLGATLGEVRRLRKWLDAHREEAPHLFRLGERVDADPELADLLRGAFDETGALSDDTWPELAEYRLGVRTTRRRILETLEELVKGDALGDALQERFVTDRGGRYVIPVKSSRRSGVGIVHDTSQSGETAFVEPLQVVESQNRLRELEAAVRREERRILAFLSSQVGRHGAALQEALAAVAALDLAGARASLGRELRGTVPRVGSEGVVRLQGARHPVLHLRGVDVVANDLLLDGRHPGLVLTGPNAGGKTVALKTVGLCALLVRSGIPVPAGEDSRVDVFPTILADVGDLQTVEQDLSTFSGRLVVLREMMERAGPGVLLLLDEVAVGTDPGQGAALARAALEAVVDRGARVVVTTHYLELKALAAVDPRFQTAGAEYRDGRPTFRLRGGHVGQSHALSVARRLGLPGDVLARAEVLLGTAGQDMARLMETLEAELDAARARTEALDAQERHLQGLERNTAERERRLEARRRDLEREVAEGYGRRLRTQEAEVKRLVAALQANPDLARAGHTLEQIRSARAAAAPRAEAPPPRPRRLEVGDRVLVPALGREGRVLEVAAGGRVRVEVGALATWLTLEELGQAPERREERPDRTRRPDPPVKPPPTPEGGFGGVPTSANTCDLRGRRVDEALEVLEQFLDRLVLRGEPVAFVLHGHGTGALKEGVRAWLPGSRYVRRWRPADEQEGGDAWTLVELG